MGEIRGNGVVDRDEAGVKVEGVALSYSARFQEVYSLRTLFFLLCVCLPICFVEF